MYLFILGRQPGVSLAELERVFEAKSIKQTSESGAILDIDVKPDIDQLGSIPKIAKVIKTLPTMELDKLKSTVIEYYTNKWSRSDHKITLGISFYNYRISPKIVQSIGLAIKKNLKKHQTSLRLIPNKSNYLNTATVLHNKLSTNQHKTELIVMTMNSQIFLAETISVQDIEAYSKRDFSRPKRDAFVGMLPPKLAQIMINLACQQLDTSNQLTVLDPFCGTGVILQEAALMGYSVYGSDLSEKMIRYSRDNLNWLIDSHKISFNWYLHQGDATQTKWRQPIDAIVCEAYLGQPFSAPPSRDKLAEVRLNCNGIISRFLKNVHDQIDNKTPLCLAIPAWRNSQNQFTHLPLLNNLDKLGYKLYKFESTKSSSLIYYRPDQVVAREIILLYKKSQA